jgi:hypothetical protein
VCITTQSQAFIDNDKAKSTISDDDITKMIELNRRALDFYNDFISAQRGLSRSGTADIDTYGTLFCLEQIKASAMDIFHYLYGAITAAQISIMLQYELDETITLSNIKGTLETTLGAVSDDVGKVVTPVLHRVKLNPSSTVRARRRGISY